MATSTTRTPGEQRTRKQKKIDQKVLERVQRGLKLLEEQHGPGWEDKIDLAKLDLANGSTCVLGQVYGDYGDGLHLIGLGDADDSEYGFCTVDADHYGDDRTYDSDRPWEALTAAWKRVLTPIVKHR